MLILAGMDFERQYLSLLQPARLPTSTTTQELTFASILLIMITLFARIIYIVIIYTKHAEEMLIFRKLKKSWVRKCIDNPDEILNAKEGKKAYLKDFGNNYLKVIVSKEKDDIFVITLYWLAKKKIKK